MSGSALQRFISQAIGYAPKARDHYDKQIQARSASKGKPLYDIERGKSLKPSLQTLVHISEVLRQPLELLTRAAQGEEVDAVEWYLEEPDFPPERVSRLDPDLLHKFNLAEVPDASHNYAMGAGAFVDVAQVAHRYFDRDWLRSVTNVAVEGLVFVRGVGDSMLPTIHEDDGVLINMGEYQLDRQDKIWAFTYGGLGMIKRIRSIPSSGDVPRYLLISDNAAIDNFEVSAEEITIRGRVVWISRRV